MSAIVFITGASSGLGLALARSVPFAARVVDISRSGPPDGTGIDHITADLSKPDTWPQVAGRVADSLAENTLDRSVFIHCAGTLTPIGPVDRVDSAAYTDNVLLNSAAGQVLGQAYLQAIADRPGTHDLVMVTSGAAATAYPGWSAYGSGKAALDQWVRTVGMEQETEGNARVSAIAPGVIDTRMQAEIRATDASLFPNVDRFRKLDSDGRLVSPENAAARIWEEIESGLKNGSVTDLRDS